MMKKTKLRPADILIATLGTEPQVVSAAHQLLRQQGFVLCRVVVLHTDAGEGPIAGSVARLQEHYASLPPESAPLETKVIRDEHSFPVRDTVNQREVDAVFRSIYAAVAEAKQAGTRVHLLIAGGRKTMSVYGMVAAQILFSGEDRLWHLHSSGEYLRSKRMQPGEGDMVSLVEVPVIRWSAIPPTFFNLQQYTDPYQALERVKDLQIGQQLTEAKIFLEQVLTSRQAEVVEALVSENLRNDELAGTLCIQPKTVDHHLSDIYQRAREYYRMDVMDRKVLARLLGLYFTLKGEEHET